MPAAAERPALWSLPDSPMPVEVETSSSIPAAPVFPTPPWVKLQEALLDKSLVRTVDSSRQIQESEPSRLLVIPLRPEAETLVLALARWALVPLEVSEVASEPLPLAMGPQEVLWVLRPAAALVVVLDPPRTLVPVPVLVPTLLVWLVESDWELLQVLAPPEVIPRRLPCQVSSLVRVAQVVTSTTWDLVSLAHLSAISYPRRLFSRRVET
jgi:hypothetical protein